MARKAPVWELLKRERQVRGRGKVADGEYKTFYSNQPFYAHLKGRNGRVVVTTETYKSKKGALNAISVVDPSGQFEVIDRTPEFKRSY